MTSAIPVINPPQTVIQALPPADWNRLRGRIAYIEEISFAPSIRDDMTTLRRRAQSPTAIFLVGKLRRTDQVIAYLAADWLEFFSHIPAVKEDRHFGRGDTIYIESIAVEPRWRGRGLGMALQRECLRRAAAAGIGRATAHLRRGVAARIGLKAKILATYENWYNTGETYDYVEFATISQG